MKENMDNIYDRVFTGKELKEMNHQLKENEFIVEIADDLYQIEYEGQYDVLLVYDEAKKKITRYYHNKFTNLGLSKEETENRITKLNDTVKMSALQNAFLDKYNTNRDISVTLPEITDQIIEEITQPKVINMLFSYYGIHQLSINDGEEKEYHRTSQDYAMLTEFYEMNKELIDRYIANDDLGNHFDNLLRKHLICKLVSEIIY